MSQSRREEGVPSSSAPTAGQSRKKVVDLVVQGCEADDANLISQAVSLGSVCGRSREDVIKMTFTRVFSRNAPKVLDHILTHGADINLATWHISHATYLREFPKYLVQILLNHGWDINHRDKKCEEPLLWLIAYDGDAVAWCLEHGANVVPKGQEQWPDLNINSDEECKEYSTRFPEYWKDMISSQYRCPPILQIAARQSTVATFELLRSKGAPLGWRVLHKAAEGASFGLPESSAKETADAAGTPLSDRELACTRNERMAMVRHLVDTLNLDVNARDQPPGGMLSGFWGTPLHYVARNSTNADCRDVMVFLLERGAHPDIEVGRKLPANYLRFVEEWRLTHPKQAGQSDDRVDHDNVG